MTNIKPEEFVVEQVIEGAAGRIVFGKYPAREYFAPAAAPNTLYTLEMGGESSTSSYEFKERSITFHAGTGAPATKFGVHVVYGQAAEVTCGGDKSDWRCLSLDEAKEIENRIRAGRAILVPMPDDHKIEYAVELPVALRGLKGGLIITSPRYDFSYNFRAFIVPEVQGGAAVEIPATGVTRFRDGGTTKVTLDGDHAFRSETPFKGGRKFIDGQEARCLCADEAMALIDKGLIPSVPKMATPFVTPFSSAHNDGPKG